MTTATKDLLTDLRAQAWRAFSESSAPAKTVETWRRMPYSEWALETLKQSDASAGAPAFSAEGLPSGAKLMPLEQALRDFPALVGPYLAEPQAASDFAQLEAANGALWRGGVFLHVPKGVKLEAPVRVSFRHEAGKPWHFPRFLALIDEGAEAQIVEEHVGDGQAVSRSAAFSRLVLGKNAKAHYFYSQELSENAAHFWHQRADLAEKAQLQHDSIMLGGRRHKSELDVRLNGEGARSDLRGALLGRAGQFFDPRTNQRHLASRTASDMLFRTALRGDARSIYTGLIRIEKTAVDCEAYQSNHNLLLSDEARADSTPILEILPDRVACKHGATAGPVDPSELFYLATRGIPEAEGLEMLILGFFDPFLSLLPIEDLRERIEASVRRTLAS